MKMKTLITFICFFHFFTVDIKAQDTLNAFSFTKNYFPGTIDTNGNFMGGTDVMYLVSHKGRLYAGNSYWNETVDTSYGPQILYKSSSVAPWQVDTTMDNSYVRTDALYSMVFKTDRFGNTLSTPDTLLVASFTDNQAPYEIGVWVRDDNTQTWTKQVIANGTTPPTQNANTNYVRMFIGYRDKYDQVDYLFAGAAPSALYRGAYDASVPGKIVWNVTPEITGPKRMTSACEANGKLYLGVASDGNPTNNVGGLFVRNDTTDNWEFIYEWTGNDPNGLGKNLRGLTAIPSSNGNYEEIIGVIENTKEIVRWNPMNNYSLTIELNVETFFDTQFGSSAFFSYAAYNNMTKFYLPIVNDTVHLIGVWVNHSLPFGTPERNNSYMLIRLSNGTYKYQRIIDNAIPIPATPGLRATRTICVSPFLNESANTIYLGGFDAGGPFLSRNGWIYKGVLQNTLTTIGNLESPISELYIYPNPTQNELTISNLPLSFKGLVSIYNSVGQLIQSEEKSGSQIILQIGKLSNGIYFIQVKSDNGQVTSSKFIKE
jgi:hypothetical protein